MFEKSFFYSVWDGFLSTAQCLFLTDIFNIHSLVEMFSQDVLHWSSWQKEKLP